MDSLEDIKALHKVHRDFELTLGRGYSLRIHDFENAEGLGSKALYAANHFHYFDPFFVGYAVSKNKDIWIHYIAKSELFHMPLIGPYVRNSRAIEIVRPYDVVKHEDGTIERVPNDEKEKQFKGSIRATQREIADMLKEDHSICFALSGTRTRNYGLDDASRENELMYLEDGEMHEEKKSLISMTILPEKKSGYDIFIVPVAVETYQKDSKKVIIKGVQALLKKYNPLLRLYEPKNKVPGDIMFGTPVHVGEFLSSRKRKTGKQDLAEKLRDDIWEMRRRLANINEGDSERSLSKHSGA
ncbi:hypothetical protein CMO89_01675 [Candidatus Woesearchaeota archaeon]|nr:hypothetical protein [Candidatus Woesearchaeota archaeon]|tara:strand:+ start:6587 stop:7483 length:897 start_codon:yes stop_codon:yes gene_type:complete